MRYESLHGNSAVALGPDVLPVIAQVDATRAHGLPQEYSEPPRSLRFFMLQIIAIRSCQVASLSRNIEMKVAGLPKLCKQC